jgi:hypothetical protein
LCASCERVSPSGSGAPGMSIRKMRRSSGRCDPELVKCRSVTLDQITEVDKQLLADRYEAAVMKEFREVATWWFQMPLDELIAKSRAHGRVFMNGSNFFLKTDEIVIEYDYELALLSRIRREGAIAHGQLRKFFDGTLF